MTELLNGRRFEGRAAGKGAAPPRTAPQRFGDIASRCPILRSSFGPNLSQIGQKTAKLLHLYQGGYSNSSFKFQDNSRTFPGHFHFFQDIFSSNSRTFPGLFQDIFPISRTTTLKSYRRLFTMINLCISQ